MLSIFDFYTPRDEVLNGHLQEDLFQANLTDEIDQLYPSYLEVL